MATKSRLPIALGVTALGGVGYYLYSAGGDSKAAKQHAKDDARRFKGREQEAARDAEKLGAQAGAKFDNTVAKTQAELQKAKNEAEAYTKDTKNAAMKKVDDLDKKVENEASKAKGGISGWFGGGK